MEGKFNVNVLGILGTCHAQKGVHRGSAAALLTLQIKADIHPRDSRQTRRSLLETRKV
jgi:hypothetical protein